jgi:two-component system phosphate regulon response regulator PhoB
MQKTILVVDDERNARYLAAITLRNRGHRVLEAEHATVARQILGREFVDCVVLDAMMPDTTGIELCEEIKSSPRTQGVPVLLLTGIAHGVSRDLSTVKRALQADEVMTKPYRLAELLRTVERLVGERVSEAG